MTKIELDTIRAAYNDDELVNKLVDEYEALKVATGNCSCSCHVSRAWCFGCHEQHKLPDAKPIVSISCNRHTDCAAADARARILYLEDQKKPFRERSATIHPFTDCHDEDCEDCFGK
jgi:hypothetical protein